MTLEIAVCDDNSTDADYIASFVRKWTVEFRYAAQIDTFPSAEAFLFKLFSFSLGQNIAAEFEYDEARVHKCLSEVGIQTLSDEMPDGLNTCLYKDFEENGVDISGGEAQKIAIARALYKGAPYLVLDEPTAALDPIAEYEVYHKFNEIVGEKLQYISAIVWLPAVFVTKLPCLTTGRLFSMEAMMYF